MIEVILTGFPPREFYRTMAGPIPKQIINFMRKLSAYPRCVFKQFNHNFLSTSPDPSSSITLLCNELKTFPSGSKNLRHLDQLGKFVVQLQKDPECAREVWDNGVVPTLVELSNCGQMEMEAQARMALSLLGYAPPYAGRGLRILSIDGGGTR